MTSLVYAAFFMGQFGYVFSMGVPMLAAKARAHGITADAYGYTEVDRARVNLGKYRQRGCKLALVGYSLGCTTATYLQTSMPIDLVVCIAESTLGQNHPINHNTKRAVLFSGPDFLSSAGQHDGFNKVVEVDALRMPLLAVPVLSHILIPFTDPVTDGVLAELAKLEKDTDR
jgi:hypothetical protein